METVQDHPREEQIIDSFSARFIADEGESPQITPIFKNIDPRVIGRSFYTLGKVYYDKSDLDKAEECFLQARKGCEFPVDFFNEFKILGFLLRIASEKEEGEKAEKIIAFSKELLEKGERTLGSLNAEFLYNQGVFYTYTGDFKQSLDHFILAQSKSKLENEPNVLAKALFSAAQNYFQLKDYGKALSSLQQLEELLKILKKTYMLGTMSLLAGNIYCELENFDLAINAYQKATKNLSEKGCTNLHGYVLMRKGVLFKKMGEFTKANWAFDMAQQTTNGATFKRLWRILHNEIADLNDSNVDIYLDRNNRIVHESTIGAIDFKHRFVLLEILFLLAQNPGGYYDKDHLAQEIWKDEYNPLIHDKLVYTSISRLRKLIEPKGEKRKYIIRGKDGYTFNPLVKARFHRETKLGGMGTIANVEISSPV